MVFRINAGERRKGACGHALILFRVWLWVQSSCLLLCGGNIHQQGNLVCLAGYMKWSLRRKSLKWFSPCPVLLLSLDGLQEPVFCAILWSGVVVSQKFKVTCWVEYLLCYLIMYQGIWEVREGEGRRQNNIRMFWYNWTYWQDCSGETRVYNHRIISSGITSGFHWIFNSFKH